MSSLAPRSQKNQGKILIIYAHDFGYPTKITNDDMLYCFRRYSNALCYYVNIAFGFPKYLQSIDFDLIVFHDLFLSKRSLPKRFKSMYQHSKALKKIKGLRIATAQDEFLQTDILNKCLKAFGIKHVFSVANSLEWKKIYPDNYKKIKIHRMLCGYVEESLIPKIGRKPNKLGRSVDIGYRASPPRYSLGYFNYLKYEIGEIVKKSAKKFGLKIDISNEMKDVFLGMDWFCFLLRCKYFLGIEGGASILDHDGSIQKRVFEYRSLHPNSTFAEIENKCFKGLDGHFSYRQITPRHFEACMTKTCQILYEGDYNGVLKPGKHYIELKKDFKNLDEVLKLVKQDKIRKKIVDRAYKDIVKSGRYTYRKFISDTLKKSLGSNYKWLSIKEEDLELFNRSLRREKLIWKYIPIKSFFITSFINLLPKKILYGLISRFS